MTPEQIKKDQEAKKEASKEWSDWYVRPVFCNGYQDAFEYGFDKGIAYRDAHPIQQVSKSDEERADEALEKQFDGTGFLEKPYSRYRYHNGYLAGMLDERAVQNKSGNKANEMLKGEIDELLAQLAKQESAANELVEALRKVLLWSESMYGRWVFQVHKETPTNFTVVESAREVLKSFEEGREKL